MMMGTEERARSRRHTSRPSILGSITSSTTRSNVCSAKRARASRPSDAWTTSYPSRCSGNDSSVWMGCSSSTRRMRAGRSGTAQSVDTVHNVLDVRVYRAAFLPALLALFVVAFSLEGRPSAVRTRSVADAFDPSRAYGTPAVRDSLLQLGKAFPRRRPGSAGDAALADRVAAVLRAAGFAVSRTSGSGRTVAGEAPIETVVGVRPGLSSRRIVVLAHRDSLDAPGLADLSGTAALLELARIFRTRDPAGEPPPDGRPQLVGRDLRKTLVLVSTSGGSGGGAGARAWAKEQDAGSIDGVLVLGDLASAASRRPWVVPWSNGTAQPPIGWQRTVEVAARQEVGESPGAARAAGQLARRAVPFSVGEQAEIDRV